MVMNSYVVDTSRSPHARLRPVAVNDVKLEALFWAPRIENLIRNTLPMQYKLLEETDRINRFRWASGKLSSKPEKSTYIFDDTDAFKWIEACAFALAQAPNSEIEKLVDQVVAEIIAAQEEDGYLFTEYHGQKSRRWRNLTLDHELYSAGHLIQAAIALHRTTGKKALLDAATKFANLISEVFSRDGVRGLPGHPEAEMALAELYRETGDRKHLETALFFLEERGKGLLKPIDQEVLRLYNFLGGAEYLIDNKPFRELDEIVGHAVRSLYLNCGATDIFIETGDKTIFDALMRLWSNFVNCKMYVTGAAGSRYISESFGENHELPNKKAYAETCAAIANVMWNWRMLLATGDAKFADIMELALYNAVLSGISLDGTRYFYINPLADRGETRRQPWFACACCPPNIARLLASLPGYFYSVSDKGVWIHLYASNSGKIDYEGKAVEIVQTTNYPWDGTVDVTLSPVENIEFSLFLRVPGWCSRAQAKFDGKKVDLKPGTYAEFRKKWGLGEKITLGFEMPVKLLVAHPHVTNNFHRVTIKRGPLVYCLEQEDSPDADLWNLILTDENEFVIEYRKDLLSGVVVLKNKALVIDENAWKEILYQERKDPVSKEKKVEATAIPYYAWANRTPGPTIVWIPYIKNKPKS